jgi:hypothetical protein
MYDNELSRKSEIDHLKELILNSGLPLEIEIVSYLANRSSLMSDLDEISTSTHYLDKDEGKGRELDINMKIGVSSEKKTSPMVFLNLLIECKKILGNAWIFLSHRINLSPRIIAQAF